MELKVNLPSGKYSILIGQKNLSMYRKFTEENFYSKQFFLIDENVYKLHKEKISELLQDNPFFVIESGEKSKSMEKLNELLRRMLESGLDRKSVLTVIGGGVAGDLGGFAASVYMRGISFIQIPTTLLSQVDSSIGGKTAVNFMGVKNIIGTFYQPDIVIIDIDFLTTLKKEDMDSGLGEIVKYGFIYDYDFAGYVCKNIDKAKQFYPEVLKKMIYNSVNIKRNVVEKDEKESDLRKILNFGHTVGHGIEMIDSRDYSHGVSITIGMYYEAVIAFQRKLISSELLDEIKKACSRLSEIPEFNEEEIKIIVQKIKHDKKNVSGEVNMVLPVGQGKVKNYKDIREQEIVESLRRKI